MVNIVISDTDGCIVREDKDKPSLLVDYNSHLNYFRKIKDFFKEHGELKFSMCTTRSLASGIQIAELSGVNTFSSFEGGNLIYDPLLGEVYSLIKKEKSLNYLCASLSDLKEWGKTIDEREIADKFGISYENMRRLEDRKTIVTLELLPYKNPPRSGHELWDLMKRSFVSGTIQALIQEGKIRVKPSSGAVDFSLNIDKGDAVRHILNLNRFRREDAVGIGDRYHSDLHLLERCGFACCPGDADEELKDYVRRKGEAGYVSEYENEKGFLDILEHTEENWI